MKNYEIRDINLAPSGHQKIQWVKNNMPIGIRTKNAGLHAEFMAQFQNHMKEQPALIDINNEEIIRRNSKKRKGRGHRDGIRIGSPA